VAEGRSQLQKLAVSPSCAETWFRRLAARKYDSSGCKTGRPRKARDIRKLVVKMALENLGWGYTKIRDAHRCDSAVAASSSGRLTQTHLCRQRWSGEAAAVARARQ
jgi:hypothetical protein